MNGTKPKRAANALLSGLLLLLALAAPGCKLRPPPDPNDPKDVGVLQIDVLQRNLRQASQAVNERVANGEITDEEGKKLLAESANKLLGSVDVGKINAVDAWKYGDLFKTAERWEQARQAYELAVATAAKAKNEDRRVNDSLRLALALAHLGKIDEAIEAARKTFVTPPSDKAPILMSVLYEVVPAAEGKGKDAELAALLEDAIQQHEKVIVNPDSDSGRSFLAAKRFHLEAAWEKVTSLLLSVGKRDEALEAAKRAKQFLANKQRL